MWTVRQHACEVRRAARRRDAQELLEDAVEEEVVRRTGRARGTHEAEPSGPGGDDHIVGKAASNILFGMRGNDTLDGAGGSDTMHGGKGNDAYVIDGGGDDFNHRTWNLYCRRCRARWSDLAHFGYFPT